MWKFLAGMATMGILTVVIKVIKAELDFQRTFVDLRALSKAYQSVINGAMGKGGDTPCQQTPANIKPDTCDATERPDATKENGETPTCTSPS